MQLWIKSIVFEILINKHWLNIKQTPMLSGCQVGCHVYFNVNQQFWSEFYNFLPLFNIDFPSYVIVALLNDQSTSERRK